jgi:8-oxo-dGTP pyrophosphatase MutT (NUDIX family)
VPQHDSRKPGRRVTPVNPSDDADVSAAGAHRDLLAPWTVTATRIVHQDRWITLRADDCVTVDGHIIAPYYVVGFPDWVVIVATDTDGRAILVRQYRHGMGVTSTELPGGAIEPDDASPAAAALRELREETGYVADCAEVLATLSANPSNHANRFHVVRIRDARRIAEPQDEPSERMLVQAVPLAEAWALACAGGMVQAMHVAALSVAVGSSPLPAREGPGVG